MNSIWWLGLFFFWPVLPFWTEGIFHKWFCQLYYSLCPTIRCCEQHLMVGVFFFLTCSPILDLGHFSQVILPIVLQIMPQPKNNPNYQVLFTASDGWGFLFTCSPILDLGHFSQMILPIVLQFMPNHQVLFTASDGWGYFFLTCSPVLDLGHFSQMILPIVLQIMPPPKITPTIRCCSQHLMVGVFFFDLFSHSGLRAFFTSDFANCTTNYAPAQK